MSKIYVKNNNNLIYEVNYSRANILSSNSYCLGYDLNLVCGYDYINPDENDIQGYVNKDRFTDNVQFETLIFYPLEESLKECLEENGYAIIEKLPKIY